MPRFEVVSLEEAESQSVTGKWAQVSREYLDYVQQAGVGQAGKLKIPDGENARVIRRRLGMAAKSSGRDVDIKRVGDEIHFWVKTRPR